MAEQSTEKSFLMLVKGISKSPSSVKKDKGTRAPSGRGSADSWGCLTESTRVK